MNCVLQMSNYWDSSPISSTFVELLGRRTVGTSNYWDSHQFDVPVVRQFVELLGFKSHYFDICNTELSNTETRLFGMFESKGDQKNDFFKELRMFVGTSIFYYDNIEKQVTLINLIKTT